MSFQRRGRSDLVISMTLAEVFVLLLFVVWWGAAEDRQPGGIPPSVTIANLTAQVRTLQLEVTDLRRQIADLQETLRQKEKRIQALEIMLDCEDGTIEDCEKGLAGKIVDARRGSPKCERENVLVAVEAHNGITQITVVGGSDDALSEFGAINGQPIERGVTLTTEADIRALVSVVGRYYQQRASSDSDCRFDYRLGYSTAEDYHHAKKYFENYFYPAGDKQRRR